MSRNVKPGITFYRMDSGHIRNPKIRLLCNEFDSDGYFIWKCLIDYGYERWGYYFDSTDTEQLELFASEYCKKKITLVKEVITGCIRRGLFDQHVADTFGILTSAMMQEVYIYATAERRRQGSVFSMIDDWLLIRFKDGYPPNLEIVHVNKAILHVNNGIVHVNNPQTKQNQDNTKQKRVAPAKPPPPRKINSLEKEPEPYWQVLVKAWFDFNRENFQEEPSFKDRDPRLLKQLAGLLKDRAAKKNVEWNENSVVSGLQYFLSLAHKDPWLSCHFLLENLVKQFDSVYMQHKQKAGSEQIKVKAPVTQDEIDLLFSSYKNGSLNIRSVRVEHYDFLNAIAKVLITEEMSTEAKEIRIKQLEGTNQAADIRLMDAYSSGKETIETNRDGPTLERIVKRLSVLNFFKQCTAQNKNLCQQTLKK